MNLSSARMVMLLAIVAAGAGGVQAGAIGGRPAMQQGVTSVPWAQPPSEFKEMQRKGFHAGVQAAIKDYDKHRDPDLERHKEYVRPKVERSYVPDFREGYKRGYNDAYKHLLKTHGQAS